jgi:multiple sugar transport system substrate-binding protein
VLLVRHLASFGRAAAPETRRAAGTVPRVERQLTRAQLVGGAAAAAVVWNGWTRRSRNAHLASRRLERGMVGGPTGFPGAARYQYGPGSAEGRAIAALRRLTANRKKPITVSILIWPGAIGHWNAPYPTKGAPTPAQVLAKEAGVHLRFVPVNPALNYQRAVRAAQSKDGSFDILQLSLRDNGDLAAAGLLLGLTDYVRTHHPDWSNPRLGYVGGPRMTRLFNYFDGEPYSVSMDGDFQVWVYREDLFDDPTNRRSFRARYGWDLAFPDTWERHAQVAQFFTRPAQRLYGSTDLKNPFWGYSNWMQRYVSSAWPDQHFFDPKTAKPLVDGPAGIRATKEHVASLAWTYPGALSSQWPAQYANLGAGGAAMSCTFANVTRYIRRGSPLDKGYGQFLRTSLAPGRRVGGRLVRRSIVYYNAQYGVNAFADPKRHEAAYLVLQWASGAHVFSWMVGNPAGYYDPNRAYTLDDPAVRELYQPYAADELKRIIPRTAPEISAIQGANEYTQALDIYLQRALSKQMSAEQAMAAVAAQWEQITDRIGRDKQIRSLQAHRGAWPRL